MSQSPMVPFRISSNANRHIVEEEEINQVLDALEDKDCRDILEVTTEEALSASELSEVCGLPLSTTYRKLEKLTETGLLDERVRLSTSGKHTSEYAVDVSDIQFSIDAEHGVSLLVSEREESEAGLSVLAGAD